VIPIPGFFNFREIIRTLLARDNSFLD
jgi:hypothetical protein